MKTKLFNKLIKLAAFIPAMAFGQDANVTLDGFNSYYNAYDNGTKNINGITVEVGADGSNSNNYISSDFQVSLYLLTCDVSGNVTSNTPIIIATYTVVSNSLHQMGTYTFSNQTVDLTQVSGLSDGMYRMGAWVNSDPNGTGIGDPPDSQNDNAGLLQSSGGTSSSSVINFSSASGIGQYKNDASLAVFPVPATDQITISANTDRYPDATLEVCDVTGKNVLQEKAVTLGKGATAVNVDISMLDNGTYFLKMKSSNELCVKKFVVNR